jgi:hypothetical protein
LQLKYEKPAELSGGGDRETQIGGFFKVPDLNLFLKNPPVATRRIPFSIPALLARSRAWLQRVALRVEAAVSKSWSSTFGNALLGPPCDTTVQKHGDNHRMSNGDRL